MGSSVRHVGREAVRDGGEADTGPAINRPVAPTQHALVGSKPLVASRLYSDAAAAGDADTPCLGQSRLQQSVIQTDVLLGDCDTGLHPVKPLLHPVHTDTGSNVSKQRSLYIKRTVFPTTPSPPRPAFGQRFYASQFTRESDDDKHTTITQDARVTNTCPTSPSSTTEYSGVGSAHTSAAHVTPTCLQSTTWGCGPADPTDAQDTERDMERGPVAVVVRVVPRASRTECSGATAMVSTEPDTNGRAQSIPSTPVGTQRTSSPCGATTTHSVGHGSNKTVTSDHLHVLDSSMFRPEPHAELQTESVANDSFVNFGNNRGDSVYDGLSVSSTNGTALRTPNAFIYIRIDVVCAIMYTWTRGNLQPKLHFDIPLAFGFWCQSTWMDSFVERAQWFCS